MTVNTLILLKTLNGLLENMCFITRVQVSFQQDGDAPHN
jgi:hypothetical protein